MVLFTYTGYDKRPWNVNNTISRRVFRAAGVASGPAAFAFIGTALFPLACLFYPFAMSIPRQVEINLGADILDIGE